jgi:uncharacterized membrane protein
MAEIPDDVKRLFFERNPKLCAWMHGISVYLAIAFLVIGVISDAINKVLGLEPNSWFIMAVWFYVGGIFAWFRGYHSAKEGHPDRK